MNTFLGVSVLLKGLFMTHLPAQVYIVYIVYILYIVYIYTFFTITKYLLSPTDEDYTTASVKSSLSEPDEVKNRISVASSYEW